MVVCLHQFRYTRFIDGFVGKEPECTDELFVVGVERNVANGLWEDLIPSSQRRSTSSDSSMVRCL